MSIELNGFTYRIKQMNAIETFALQATINMDTPKDAENAIKNALEHIEVNVGGDAWQCVKEQGREVYYPAGIENDYIAVSKLFKMFLEEVGKVFQKSNA